MERPSSSFEQWSIRYKAVIFDSGNVLVHPRGGSWFPGHRFAEIIAAHNHYVRDLAGLAGAIQRATPWFEEQHPFCRDEDVERDQFAEFFRRVLGDVGDAPSDDLCLAIAHSYVDEHDHFVLDEDACEVLDRLRPEGYLLGLISNSWPSLERKYQALGLRGYFHSFLGSYHLGCFKPDPRLFQTSLAQLGVQATEAIFVDDWYEYVEAAIALGLGGILYRRGETVTPRPYPTVAQLTDVLQFLS